MEAQGESKKNWYTTPLTPFTLAEGDGRRPFTAADTFDTREIGYVFDELPERRPQPLTAAPTFALFEQVDHNRFVRRSFELHVFLVPLAEKDAFAPPSSDPLDFPTDPRYCGLKGVSLGSRQPGWPLLTRRLPLHTDFRGEGRGLRGVPCHPAHRRDCRRERCAGAARPVAA